MEWLYLRAPISYSINKKMKLLFLTTLMFSSSARLVAGFRAPFFTTTTSVPLKGRLSTSAAAAAAKTVLVPIGHGSEEIETTCIVDTLVRAGAEVTLASVEPEALCVMSRGVRIMADASFADDPSLEMKSWDAIVCPGGMPGAEKLRDSDALNRLLEKQNGEGKIVAAVCAAPAVVLEAKGILRGKKATCYPALPFISKLELEEGRYTGDADVVVDGHVVTSRGPGTSLKFALKLVELLFGEEKAEELTQQMLVR